MSINILVADDEKAIADLIEICLKNENYSVYKFYNGKDAWESIENTTVKPDQIYKDIKKLLQTCRLTKYTSADKCAEFYTVFFMQTLQEPVRLTIDEWSIVYNKLMCDNVFIENLSLYIAMYHPLEYRGMFQSLYNEFLSEFTQMKTRRIAFAGTVKALFSMLEMKFDEIRVILAASNDKEHLSL